MVRRYRDRPVDSEAVHRILEAARRGPSAGFAQGIEFVVVTDVRRRVAIAEAADEPAYVERGFEPWLSVAPVHVVIAVDPERYRSRYAEEDKNGVEEWTAPYWWVDAGAALMIILLAAVEEGLAAGFLGAHAIDSLSEVVALPHRFETLGVVTIGHPADNPVVGSARRPRREATDVIHHEIWTAPAERDESN